jgi:hypothetical protein
MKKSNIILANNRPTAKADAKMSEGTVLTNHD